MAAGLQETFRVSSSTDPAYIEGLKSPFRGTATRLSRPPPPSIAKKITEGELLRQLDGIWRATQSGFGL